MMPNFDSVMARLSICLDGSALSVATGLTAVSAALLYILRNRSNYPPGPKPLFYFGHIFQIPRNMSWRYFNELGKTFGPIMRFTLAGDDILVLNDSRDAEELLGRRSVNYSSRKQPIYAGKYQSDGRRLVLTPYGEEMKKQRIAFQYMLQPRAVSSYEAMQDYESIRLLMDMLRRPEDLAQNCKRYTASLVFSLAYGRRLPDDDKDLAAVLEIGENFKHDCYPGSHLVDTFPILDKLPDFLSPWRIEARKKHQNEVELFSRLILEARDNMKKETHLQFDCFATRLWEGREKLNIDLITMSYICGVAFEAGTDSSSATMCWFLFAMALHPHILVNAQAEIDSVLGGDGSSVLMMSDLKNLPYCAAVCKEVFRWYPAAAGGFPHLSNKEDEYKGYRIKPNTMVIPNTFSMHRNEDEYPDAETFKPERFLQEGPITDAWMTEGHYGFGFGRRACPGKYLASKNVWIGMVRLMWAFNISPEKDSSGQFVALDPKDSSPGITTAPNNLSIIVEPRSPRHAQIIETFWQKLEEN